MESKGSSDLGWWTAFIIFVSLLFALSCFPGVFDWSNTIKPWVMGMPFASFWQLLLSALAIIGIGVFYKIEEAKGVLDMDVEPD